MQTAARMRRTSEANDDWKEIANVRHIEARHGRGNPHMSRPVDPHGAARRCASDTIAAGFNWIPPLIAFLCAMLMLFTKDASSQNYPTRPIRMLVGFTPAGPTDLTARLAAQNLSEALGQPVIVDNRPGAGGTVAGALLAQAQPDGYTIALGANGEIAIAPNLRPRLTYDPVRDFSAISRIGSGQLVLLVHPAVAAKSVAELISLARTRPGTINFASSGTGSTAHLCAELFKYMAAIDIVHVPYKGAGPALPT